MKRLIIGSNSFIGNALEQKLFKLGGVFSRNLYNLDIRKPIELTERYDLVFHFASPSSQVLFDRNPEYCIDTTIRGFKNVLDYCRRTGAKLIYPSTGLINYRDELNTYSKCKLLCEEMAEKSGVETLGLRIFAGYGPGEEHKRDYASVITIFLREMMQGKRPIVFGDGEQERDFIYIDDIVDAILTFSESEIGIKEIGSGEPETFNRIIEDINRVLDTEIKPIYVPAPKDYITETECKEGLGIISIDKGIRKTYESYCNNND